MKFSVGIGITNRCNYNCSHCYSREDREYNLPFSGIKKLCDNLDIAAINFGTGESGLHKEFNQIMEYVYNRGIKMALTTNGYTVDKLSDNQLKMFNDIDFSLDFPDKSSHDGFRGIGATNLVIKGVERCKELGVEASFACAMLKDNYKIMDKMTDKARKLDINLRINIYKPVNTFKHYLSYEEFWEGIERLFANSMIVSCSEPIVNVLINNKSLDGGSPCGKRSLRIRPDGGILDCVYCKKPKTTIDELLENKNTMSEPDFTNFLDIFTESVKIIPDECKSCDFSDICKGGCMARRHYTGGINKPDTYCFLLDGRTPPKIDYQWGNSKDLVHSGYLCTIIVQ